MVQIVATHLNYRSRAEQRGRQPAAPSYFLKPSSTLAASGDDVVRPLGCSLLAFEGEIAVVLKDVPRNVSVAEAWGFVSAVTAANDFGVYDLRYADPGSNVHSKGWDGFTPIGPTFLDASRIDPATLRLETWVDGELLQNAGADDMLFTPAYIIADLSRVLSLAEGDIILLGTPAGSTVIVPGQTVEVNVSARGTETGRLRNRITEGQTPIPNVGAQPRRDPDAEKAALG